MKQTAVEWLFNELLETPKDKFFWYSILEKAKQMEARQKIDLTEICKCDSTGQTWVCNCCGRPYIENKNK